MASKDYFFKSYAHYSVDEVMLKDKVQSLNENLLDGQRIECSEQKQNWPGLSILVKIL